MAFEIVQGGSCAGGVTDGISGTSTSHCVLIFRLISGEGNSQSDVDHSRCVNSYVLPPCRRFVSLAKWRFVVNCRDADGLLVSFAHHLFAVVFSRSIDYQTGYVPLVVIEAYRLLTA